MNLLHKKTGKVISKNCLKKVSSIKHSDFEPTQAPITHTIRRLESEERQPDDDDTPDFLTTFVAAEIVSEAISSFDTSSSDTSSDDFGGFGGGDFGGGGAGGDW